MIERFGEDTGHKDATGAVVRVGDVLEETVKTISSDGGSSWMVALRGVVICSERRFVVQNEFWLPGEAMRIHRAIAQRARVVGNAHANPDLLTPCHIP